MTTLKVENLTVRFGGLLAVYNLSFETKQGEILSVIGPNGAGKTTLFNSITGYIKPTTGKVTYENTDITGKPAYEVSKLGVVRTFQKRSFFPTLTVLENVLLGQHMQLKPGWVEFVLSNLMRKKEEEALQRADSLLEFVGLKLKKNVTAGLLSYGEQRLLGIAIALAAQPKLVLLDEPCAGSNPHECTNMVEVIKNILQLGVSIILVEHHMRVVMGLSNRIIVLSYGEKLAEGTPLEIQENPSVISAYLGKRGGCEAHA